MVLQNRLDYGFNGYQVPRIPRASRSYRRSSFRNRVDDKQMGAFDMLASVAGNLLLERRPSSPCDCETSTVKDYCENIKIEKPVENNNLKVEPRCEANCGRKFLISGPGNGQDCSINTSMNVIAENLEDKKTNGMGDFVGKEDFGSPHQYRSCDPNLDGGKRTIVESEKVPSGLQSGLCSLRDPVDFDWKPQTLVGSENGVKAPAWKNRGPQHSCPSSRVDAKVVGRDNENYFGYTQPTTSVNSFRTAPRMAGQRIRKILASKNWKVAAKYGADRPNIGGYTRQFYINRRNSYKNQRSQMNIPFKKRKLFDSCFSNCNGGKITEGNSTEKGTKRKCSAHRKSSLLAGHQGESRVKLRIKSFRVPELFIEIPETATVSSLKRTVMEAVTTIIGHGIHVGVLIRGKKVRDDDKTLFQTGISRDNQDDFLGFTLEPHASQTSSSLCHGDFPSTSPCSNTPEPITGCLPNPTEDYPDSNGALLLESHAALSDSIGSDGGSLPSLAAMPVYKSSTDSKALVTVPAMTMEALAVVPVCQKPKRMEVGQRRMRRPFSVAEVEALVHAVETLGTGRWRDVKLQAFDDAKHRTYVDLKDKWKTLVHTARIAPQQRRGEAVPQELLDRVLAAHAHWSQQQQQQPHSCVLLP